MDWWVVGWKDGRMAGGLSGGSMDGCCQSKPLLHYFSSTIEVECSHLFHMTLFRLVNGAALWNSVTISYFKCSNQMHFVTVYVCLCVGASVSTQLFVILCFLNLTLLSSAKTLMEWNRVSTNGASSLMESALSWQSAVVSLNMSRQYALCWWKDQI